MLHTVCNIQTTDDPKAFQSQPIAFETVVEEPTLLWKLKNNDRYVSVYLDEVSSKRVD